LIVSSLDFCNLSTTVGWGSALSTGLPPAEKKFFVNTQMSGLSCRMGMGGNWELLNVRKWEWGLHFR